MAKMNSKIANLVFGFSFLVGAAAFGFASSLFISQSNQASQGASYVDNYAHSSFTFAGTVFFTGALIFLIIAIWAFVYRPFGRRMNAAQIQQLKTTGQKVLTQFKAIDRQWGIEVNGQSPIIIFTQDDQGRTYKSDALWFSGGDTFLYGDTRFQAWQKLQSIDPTKKYIIPVYINPIKPEPYFMDLGGLEIQE